MLSLPDVMRSSLLFDDSAQTGILGWKGSEKEQRGQVKLETAGEN